MLKCPRCQRAIPDADINVGTDVAFCRPCKVLHRLSQLAGSRELDEIDLSRLPVGVWHRREGQGCLLGASQRSVGAAMAALAFGVFWNGIVSVFVLFNLASTLRLLGVRLPEWFPAPHVEGGSPGVGMTIFLWVFLIPFIGVGLTLVGTFLVAVAGKTEVRLRRGRSSVFTGVGILGWTRSFKAESVAEVRLGSRRTGGDDDGAGNRSEIVIREEGGRQLGFGGSLPAERKRYLAAALRRELREFGVQLS